MALPPSQHQHCTDEAQKAETVLSAVSYIYIYIYIYIYMFHGLELLVFFFVLCFAKSCALLRCVSFPLSNSCTYEFVKHISNLVNFT